MDSIERQAMVARLTPLPWQADIPPIKKLFIPLPSHRGRVGDDNGEQGQVTAEYCSLGCVCTFCLREDYAACQYSPEGSLTMATWRDFYYAQGGH
jgi:hypothetical protein